LEASFTIFSLSSFDALRQVNEIYQGAKTKCIENAGNEEEKDKPENGRCQ